MPHPDDDENEAKPFVSAHPFPAWDQIEAALREVFFASDSAYERLNRLRDKVMQPGEALGPDFLPSLLHLDPFQIAKDLAGVSVATTDQKVGYVKLLKRFSSDPQRGYDRKLLDEVSQEDLSREVPDDTRAPN